MAPKEKDVLISIVKDYMIWGGFWPRSLSTNPLYNKLFSFFSVLTKINYAYFYVTLLMELIRLLIGGYSFQVILSSFGIVINATKIAVKIVIYSKNNVLDMINDVVEREREIWAQGDEEIIALYLEKIKVGKLFRFLLTSSTIFVLIGLNGLGAYGNLQLIKYNEEHNASLESHYMYQFWFPGNKLEHLNWVYVISFFNSYAGGTYNVITHMGLITLLVYSATHLTILQHRLRHYIPDDFKEEQMDEKIAELKGYVMEHLYLIKFTESVNDRCKNIIMMEFILSSFDVATSSIIMIKQTSGGLAWYGIFFVLLVIQIFCLSWSCNEVNLQSRAVADGAFESNWRLLNKEGRQITQIIMQRAAHRPLNMTIGPFGPMTTESFLMIMKAAYGYVSIMRK